MSELSLPFAPVRSSPTLETVVHTHHRYVLPVLAGLSFFLGGVTLFRGSAVFGGWVAIPLIGLGAGSLSASLAYVHWRHPANSQAQFEAPLLEATYEPLAAEAEEVVTGPVDWEDLFYRRFDADAQATGTASSLRVVFTPTSAADQLWVHWLPAEVGHLPTDLAPPIATEPYFPPESELSVGPPPPEVEAVDLVPDVLPEEVLAMDASLPPPGAPGPALTMVEVAGPTPELPPPAGTSEAVPSISAARIPTPLPVDDGVPHWMRAILAEALNPVPPHLRSSSPREPVDPAAVGVA